MRKSVSIPSPVETFCVCIYISILYYIMIIFKTVVFAFIFPLGISFLSKFSFTDYNYILVLLFRVWVQENWVGVFLRLLQIFANSLLQNAQLLSQFVSPFTGRIYGRHITGLCTPMQRWIALLIKRSQKNDRSGLANSAKKIEVQIRVLNTFVKEKNWINLP
jgi:hypothetical protein